MRNTSSISFCCNVLFFLVWIITELVAGVSIDEDLSLTLKQKQALDKFREQVNTLLYKDYMKTDIYLIRWLRAKNFNVNDAEAMLKENIRWRQEHNIDNIQSEDFKDMFQDYPATLDTSDLQGRPIAQIDIYYWDIRSCVLSGKSPRLLRYLDMLMDNVTMQVFERQQKSMNVAQWVALSNTDGFNMVNHIDVNHGCAICIPVWIQFLSSLENHFQGWMDEFIIIEAPLAVHTIINILSPFLSRQTRDGLHIFGQNKNQWMRYLDQKISREERRPVYGGTKPAVERE